MTADRWRRRASTRKAAQHDVEERPGVPDIGIVTCAETHPDPRTTLAPKKMIWNPTPAREAPQSPCCASTDVQGCETFSPGKNHPTHTAAKTNYLPTWWGLGWWRSRCTRSLCLGGLLTKRSRFGPVILLLTHQARNRGTVEPKSPIASVRGAWPGGQSGSYAYIPFQCNMGRTRR